MIKVSFISWNANEKNKLMISSLKKISCLKVCERLCEIRSNFMHKFSLDKLGGKLCKG